MIENYQLYDIDEMNNVVLTMMGNYLNQYPDFIQTDTVDEIVKDCDVSPHYAFTLLLAAACGLDIHENEKDAHLFHHYFLPMVSCLNTEAYSSNAYYQNIQFPNIISGNWTLRYENYKPYEAFVYNDFAITKDGRMLPQIGFFPEEFSFPAILEGERIWMTITPNEIETMKEPIDQAFGHVLTFGLGLGYYPYMISLKESISSITIVERNEDVIRVFQDQILPQFQHKDKVKVIHDDAFSYAKNEFGHVPYDYIFTDLWHDVSDGINLYLKMKKYEHLCPDARFAYWIEKSILCYL